MFGVLYVKYSIDGQTRVVPIPPAAAVHLPGDPSRLPARHSTFLPGCQPDRPVYCPAASKQQQKLFQEAAVMQALGITRTRPAFWVCRAALAAGYTVCFM